MKKPAMDHASISREELVRGCDEYTKALLISTDMKQRKIDMARTLRGLGRRLCANVNYNPNIETNLLTTSLAVLRADAACDYEVLNELPRNSRLRYVCEIITSAVILHASNVFVWWDKNPDSLENNLVWKEHPGVNKEMVSRGVNATSATDDRWVTGRNLYWWSISGAHYEAMLHVARVIAQASSKRIVAKDVYAITCSLWSAPPKSPYSTGNIARSSHVAAYMTGCAAGGLVRALPQCTTIKNGGLKNPMYSEMVMHIMQVHPHVYASVLGFDSAQTQELSNAVMAARLKRELQ